MKFAIGYNQQPDFNEVVEEFKEVAEVYFPIDTNITGSGRVKAQDSRYRKDIQDLISSLSKKGIRSNLLINGMCEGKVVHSKRHVMQILNEIKRLIGFGLTDVTLNNLVYTKIVRRAFPDITLQASVNCGITSPEKANYYDVDVITVDRDINRKLDVIRSIKESTGKKIKVLVNEGCLLECPCRTSHFNMISHKVESDFYTQFCRKLSGNRKHLINSPFIRPEDLKHYGFVDFIKLGTRGLDTKRVKLALRSYIDGHFSGNLYDIMTTYRIRPKLENSSIKSRLKGGRLIVE